MSWYVLRTICGKEEGVLSILNKMGTFSEFEIFYPKKRIGWRKKGNIISIIRPLFEGYLFVSANERSINRFDYLLRNCKLNRAWLVQSAGCLAPISNEEKNILEKLMDCEKVVECSKVKVIKDQFEVVEGPLLGLEYTIKKISYKNRRIIVELPILEEKKQIELEGMLIKSSNES